MNQKTENKLERKEFTVPLADFVCVKLGIPIGSTMSVMAEDEHRARYLLLCSLEQKIKDKERHEE